jgi:hypothetical protein
VGRVRITERDLNLLRFTARQRIVLVAHAQALLGTSAGAVSARMGALARAGLLERHAVYDRQPPCYLITRKGLQAIGSKLPRPRLELRYYRHDVGAAWLWLAAQRGAFGPLAGLVSEREMRSRDGVQARAGGEGDRLAVRLGGHQQHHYPDLLLIGPGGRRVAVELELTCKARTRRERILAGYGADRRIDAVLYLVDRPGVARAVRASAARLGISSRVDVHAVRWGAGIDQRTRGRPGVRAGARMRAAEAAR